MTRPRRPPRFLPRSTLPLLIFLSAASLSAAQSRGEAAASRQARTVVVGVEWDYPPFTMVRGERAAGFSIELLREAAETAGLNLEYHFDSWDRLLELMAAGELDILPIVARTDERLRIMDFSFPYIIMKGNIFIRSGDERIRGQESLAGMEIFVQEADVIHDYAVAKGLGARMRTFPTYTEAFEALSAGEGDAVLAANLVGNQVLAERRIANVRAVSRLKDDGLSRIRVELDDFEQKFCFGFRKGDYALAAALDEGLAIAFSDGRFQSLYRRWFPYLADNRPSARLLAAYLAFILIPLLALAALAYTVLLRRQVRAKATEIARSYGLLQGLIDHTPAPIYVFGVDGRLISCNAEYERIFGVPRGFTTGKTREEFMQADQAARYRANDLEIIESGRPAAFDEAKPGVGGVRYFHSVKFPLFDADGKVYAVCGVSSDITERYLRDADLEAHNAELVKARVAAERAREDAERARAEAERANEVKSQFLSNMSHEIRNPLNGVIGMAGLLAHTDLDAEQRQYLELISASGETLLAIVNDILDLARIEAGKRSVKLVSVDMRRFMASIRAMYEQQARAKGLGFEIMIGDDVGAITSDELALTQIVSNLAGNAVKFTERGRIRVAAERLAGGGLELSVADTGIGIPAERLDHIFEKFTQLDSGYTKRYQGSGLGLSIARELATLIGAELYVESELGRRSRFALRLDAPLTEMAGESRGGSEPTARDDAPASAERSGRAIQSVLVVEDNAVNVMMLTRLLARAGYEADSAMDGEAALRKAEARAYDAVLMDIQMPVMNGLECAAGLRERGYQGYIIAVTGYALKDSLESFKAAGMDAALGKPVVERELLATLASFGGAKLGD